MKSCFIPTSPAKLALDDAWHPPTFRKREPAQALGTLAPATCRTGSGEFASQAEKPGPNGIFWPGKPLVTGGLI